MKVMQALWDSGALTQFEEECDKLCVRASEEARICDSRAGLEAQLQSLDEIHNVYTSVKRLEDKVVYRDIRLEEAQELSIAHNIRVFYEHEFSKIRKDSWMQHDELPAERPAEPDVQSLVSQAIPLFIFAFTVSRYIAEVDPRGRLDLMLRQSLNKSLTGLKGTYLPILTQVVASRDDDRRESRIMEFKRIVGSLVLLYDPLSASALMSLIGALPREVVEVLRPLHSVLNISQAVDGRLDLKTPITLFHLSFRDFLIDSALKENIFWIEAAEMHSQLGMHCIRLLESGGLKEDVCGVVAPGTRRSEVAKSVVCASLPEALTYACCYWIQHVVSGEEQIKDDSAVLPFLEKHILHWMEALSWLGKTSDVIHNLAALRSVVDVSRTPIHTRNATYLLVTHSSTKANSY
jgi:hypothetical protein